MHFNPQIPALFFAKFDQIRQIKTFSVVLKMLKTLPIAQKL